MVGPLSPKVMHSFSPAIRTITKHSIHPIIIPSSKSKGQKGKSDEKFLTQTRKADNMRTRIFSTLQQPIPLGAVPNMAISTPLAWENVLQHPIFFPKIEQKLPEEAQEPQVQPDAVELIDPEGNKHTLINITGLLQREVQSPTATLHIKDEIGRGSERQVYIGNLTYESAQGINNVPVAVITQSIEMPKTWSWNPLVVVLNLFYAPEGEISPEKLAEAQREYSLLKEIGSHPHVDSERLMGMGTIIGTKLVNVTSLAKGDLLAIPPAHLTFDGILDLMKQGAEGLAHIHSKGYCHNDVKPENFLLYPGQEGNYTVKLSDFGHMAKEGQKATKPLGTPSFAPMEKGTEISKKYDERAFAQTCLDLFITDFADFTNESQRAFFVNVTTYFSDIVQGKISATAEDMAKKLAEFSQEAKQLNFKELGHIDYKGKIKAAEEKRLEI
jgi:hypothetical protein